MEPALSLGVVGSGGRTAIGHFYPKINAIVKPGSGRRFSRPFIRFWSITAKKRMYTMVVALGLLAGYCLLHAVDEPAIRRGSWTLYTLAATAAIYTHYFALFLLPALIMAALLTDPRPRRLVRPLLLSHLAIGALFGVWLLPLLTQFTTDTSYWHGTFKLGEALFGIAVRFAVGETVLESNAWPYLLLAAIATFTTVSAIVYWARRDARRARTTLTFALCWLVVPVISVLFLATFVPKFNERYVLVALPGLIVLWATGMAALNESMHPHRKNRIAIARTTLAFLLLVFGFQMSIRNWFTDHSFLKAQWREAAAYVRQHHEPGEAVILVSGHAWPVWDYYAPDLPAIHLPDLRILDVNAVLDFANSGPQLRTALADNNGAWLVNWQEEVVDPTGVVPVQLAWAAEEKTFRSSFWEVGVRRFVNLDASAIPMAAPITHRLDGNFGNELRLLGYTVTPRDELLLFWQRHPKATQPAPDWQITLRTETSAGLLYHTPTDRRPVDYNYPVDRWRPDGIVMGLIPADDWLGPAAMPGEYHLQLGVYNPADAANGLDWVDTSGQSVGKFVTLVATEQGHTSDKLLPVPDDIVQVTPDARVYLPPPGEPLVAGDPLVMTLLWYLEDTFTTGQFVLRWRAEADEALFAESVLPLPSGQPLAVWPRHDWLRHMIQIQVPDVLPPGDYFLSLEPIGVSEPSEVKLVRRHVTIAAN
ncbi:MAG: glycosyltransferase family 39 protein [Caldilineaceae bacterium]